MVTALGQRPRYTPQLAPPGEPARSAHPGRTTGGLLRMSLLGAVPPPRERQGRDFPPQRGVPSEVEAV